MYRVLLVEDEEIELGEDEDDVLVAESVVEFDVALEEAVVPLVAEELLKEGEEIEEE